MAPPEIKTIVFDLGGVYFTNGSVIAMAKIKEIYEIKDVERLKMIFSNKQGTPGEQIRLGLITMEEFENRAISELNIPKKEKHHIHHLWFGSYVPNYKMAELTQKLKENYKIMAFSGNVKERIEYLDKRYNFLKNFNECIFSYDYQLNKEHAEFYKILIEHLDCKPQNALFIDDEKTNINLAESFGFNCILYYYTEQLIEELKKYGIEINIFE
ncbi:MAG: HAD-IA family hydrolase [Promethearchaeota archaeon]